MTTPPRHPDPLDEGPPDSESLEGQDRPELHGEQDRPADYAEADIALPDGYDDRQEDATPDAARPTPEEQLED